MLNICMIGHGMMGGWHSTALRGIANLHTIAGRDPEATRAFSEGQGYANWTTDWRAAVANPAVDAVIIAGPSQSHAEMGLAAIEAGKPVLVEIPLALTLSDCQALVDMAGRKGIPLGVVHPMRFRAEHVALVERVRAGDERVRHVHSRLFLHRLTNVGSTGLVRTWTDNLLWHHGAHLVDVGLWLCGAGDPASVQTGRVLGLQPVPHESTGMPMEMAAIVETGAEQSVVCTGSYHSRTRIFDVLVVTDRDTYHLDILSGRMTTSTGPMEVASEEANNSQVARDFVESLVVGRSPRVTGASVLPAMSILHRIERGAGA